MSRHTPGPWTYEIEESKRYDERTGEPRISRFKWINANQKLTSDGSEFKISVASIMPGGNDSDAHLIAAAPDMFKLLKEVLDYCLDNEIQEMDGDLLQNIANVIQKAKGES